MGLGWQALQQRHIFPIAANAGEHQKSSLDCQPKIYPELGICVSFKLLVPAVSLSGGVEGEAVAIGVSSPPHCVLPWSVNSFCSAGF